MPLLARVRALESIVREVAREAVMPRYLKVVRERKADGSLMTEADLAAQAALAERLPEVMAAPVIGEEMSEAQQRECWEAGREGVWCIDPIDGTTNFASGLPLFAVAVAYLVNGQAQFGVVFNPLTDESFYAARGAGAWLNGRRLPMRQAPHTLSDAVAAIDFKRIPKPLAQRLAVAPPYYSMRSFGSSALEWAFVAAGRLDVYLHGGQSLWDYAAGRLMVDEAGGMSCALGGGALQPDPVAKRAVVVAANPALFEQWCAWLRAAEV